MIRDINVVVQRKAGILTATSVKLVQHPKVLCPLGQKLLLGSFGWLLQFSIAWTEPMNNNFKYINMQLNKDYLVAQLG